MQSHWKDAESLNTIVAYEEFLERYPDGPLAEEARSRIEKLHFEQAKAKDTIAVYEEFVDRYSEGVYADKARLRIEELYFEQAQAKNTIAAYEEFLEMFPHGTLTNKANLMIEKLYLEKADTEGTIPAYKQFLKQYPHGEFTEKARTKLSQISQQTIDLISNVKNIGMKVDVSGSALIGAGASLEPGVMSLTPEFYEVKHEYLIPIRHELTHLLETGFHGSGYNLVDAGYFAQVDARFHLFIFSDSDKCSGKGTLTLQLIHQKHGPISQARLLRSPLQGCSVIPFS